MKRILTILCALALVMAGSATALAADASNTGQSASYYPISVEEYTYGDFDELRINKTYQLSLADDPSLIPTEDFVRNGRRYYLLDMTRKDEVGVDIQTHTETVTQASDTNNLETILQRLDAEMEVTTEDGYAGVLRLDHTSVQVTTDGYATKTSTLSASRSYPNLSEADISLIPKTIEDKGKTLTLGDVKWSESMDVDGKGNPVTRYTATASYTGTATSRYATSYTVSANYTGEVSKANCAVVTYTAIFGSEKAAEEFKAPSSDEKNDDHAVVVQAVLIQQAGFDEAPDHLGGDASLLKIGKHPPLVRVGDGQDEGRLGKLFFDAINRCLEQAGRMMRGGSIVDATLISAPSSTKNAEKKRDEIKHAPQFSAIEFHINRRPGKLPRISDNAIDWERYIENRKSSVRCKVEHPYRVVKNIFGFRKTVYRGLRKNLNRLHVLFASANLYMLAKAGGTLYPA